MARRLSVVVVSGGPSAEHRISRLTGQMVARALDRKTYRVTLAVVDRQRRWRFSGQGRRWTELRALAWMAGRFDVAFLALHGAYGEDGTIQALLRSIGLPYTGSGVTASALAWDKAAANRVAEGLGMHVPRWMTVGRFEQLSAWRRWPAMVKPVESGSSIDAFRVRGRIEGERTIVRLLKRYDRVMVQDYVIGRELTCGVVEVGRTPRALPVTEIRPRRRSFFDYYSKYTTGATQETTPADLPAAVTRAVQQAAILAHQAFQACGFSRSDFMLRGRTPWYLETNTIPGLTRLSLFPQEAVAAGISLSQLFDLIIRAAVRKRPRA